MSRRLSSAVALIFLFASLAAALSIDYLKFAGAPLSRQNTKVDYELKPGSSVRLVAEELHDLGLMSRPRYFALMARFGKQAGLIQAGEYTIDPSTKPAELLAQFASGRVKLYSLTIVEGWTFRQMLRAVNAHSALVHTLGDLSDEEIMARLGAAGEHPEGRFLPDTYKFPQGTSDQQFLSRAHKAMTKTLARLWEDRAEGVPLTSAYEALILASIVERETAVPAERGKIAGVFAERLRRGMRLQTDPTVIYGLGDAFTGDLRYRDLRRDTAYNTYTRKGLTPTPIALPSKEAIRAALHPENSGALYFVARGDGTHAFSKSLREHNAAVIKYQLDGDARRLKGR